MHNLSEAGSVSLPITRGVNCQLKFKIFDPQDEFALDLSARPMRVNLTNAFLDDMGGNGGAEMPV